MNQTSRNFAELHGSSGAPNSGSYLLVDRTEKENPRPQAEGFLLVRDLGLEPRTQGLRIPCSTN